MQTEPPKILRLNEVIDRTGLSRSTIYSQMAEGEFPKNISLSAKAVGWLESDLQTWIDNRILKGENNA